MITKDTFKIHFLFYLVAFICIVTGYFKHFIIFSSIIIIHELGHIVGAFLFKWKIEKIVLLPFGGITIFNEKIDKSLLQEFIIAILGPLFQIVFFLIYKNNNIFTFYNISILVFNLIPIYPLDGSKILNVILNRFISFKLSHILTIIISSILIVYLVIISIDKQLLFLIVLVFIIFSVVREIFKHKYYFNKFLLERYLYNFNYKRRKVVKKIEKMKKQTKHTFLINKKYYTEREIMSKRFDK